LVIAWRVLEAAGIVRREPVGRGMFFLLEPEPLLALQAYLERLKAHVER
jgi:hypothetical protein